MRTILATTQHRKTVADTRAESSLVQTLAINTAVNGTREASGEWFSRLKKTASCHTISQQMKTCSVLSIPRM